MNDLFLNGLRLNNFVDSNIKCILVAQEIIFPDVEYKFHALKHMFLRLKYKFHVRKHKNYCIEETFVRQSGNKSRTDRIIK